MKKGLLLLCLIFAIGCSKHSEQIEIVKNDMSKKKSVPEMEGIRYTSYELSDREAYKEIYKYYMKRYNKYQDQYLLSKAGDAQKLQGTATGEKKFVKVEALKMNPDTTDFRVYYFDEKNTIIQRNLIK